MNSKKITLLIISSLLIVVLLYLGQKKHILAQIEYAIQKPIELTLSSGRTVTLHPFKADDSYAIVLPAKLDSSKVNQENIKASNVNTLICQIPVTFITTESGTMKNINSSKDKSVKEKGWITVIDKNGRIQYDGILKEIKGRGNFTWKFDPKRPYNIELEENATLFSLKKGKKYSLIASYTEPTIIRNHLAMEIAREAMLPNSISSSFTHLYLNGHYAGLYQVTNKVEISKSAVNITDLSKETQKLNKTKLKNCTRYSVGKDKNFDLRSGIIANNPQDITGGYLLETYAVDASSFHITHAITTSMKSPKYATKEQVEYIADHFSEILNAIYSPDGINEKTKKHYSQYIDVESFAKYYLIQEVLLNRDGGVGSFYMYKDIDSVDSLIYAGPLWDMGSGIGNPCLLDYALNPQMLFVKGKKNYEGEPIFLCKLLEHKEYQQLVDSLYRNCIKGIVWDYCVGEKFNSICQDILPELTYNNYVWNRATSSTDIQKEFEVIRVFIKQRLEMFDRWTTRNSPILPVYIQLNRPNFVLESYQKPNGAIALPKIDRIREGYATDGWYWKNKNKYYTEGDNVQPGDTIEMRWRKKEVKDLFYYFWEKKEVLFK